MLELDDTTAVGVRAANGEYGTVPSADVYPAAGAVPWTCSSRMEQIDGCIRTSRRFQEYLPGMDPGTRGPGSTMNTNEIEYILEPTTFHSMQEAQDLANTLEENLQNRRMGAASVSPEVVEVVEVFSELVNNAAEPGMTPEGAHAHVRYMPHRKGQAFDVVVAD